ncbi:TPA: DNA polymerase II [Candidatus Woesearchaeota archaeon]|nr:DNA polymerase II [Candidatus Woesearchaeota archaeon]HIH39930.1 DNA polymerase II [Candidatus Woesearchaeota archaeon]
MRGFIVYPTYRISDEKDKALIYLFGRLENGESFLTINEYKPYFYIKTEDQKKAEELITAEFEETEKHNFKGEKLTKVIFKIPSELKEKRDLLENHKVKTYESDVLFTNRFLIDHDITASMEINGEFKKANYVDRIYENPELKPAEFHPNLKVLSIDIEAEDPDPKKKIYSISMYDGEYKKVFIISDKNLNDAVSFGDEKSLLQAFRQKIIDLDPDLIVGWNIVDFDLDYLKQKFDQHKIEFKLGRADWPCKLRIESSFFKDSKADFPGRQVLDGIQLLKGSFIKLQDYRLDTAAREILGERKLIGHENKFEEIHDAYKNNPQKLVDYNLSDSKLVYDILNKLDLINLTALRSFLTGMSMDRVNASVASLDSLYLRTLIKHGIVANSLGEINRDEERIKGGFVMESIPGIYDYVIVLDFKSLYPSLMRTFNIDPYSFVEKPPKELDRKKYIKCANGAVFRNDFGFLPQIIERVWKQRDIAKKKKDTTASNALKILMNSMFGALANPASRYYSLDIANAITHTGQFMIKLCADKIKEAGYKVIYGDTDSLFILPNSKSSEESEKTGNHLAGTINSFLNDYIKENYERESFMELQFDKVFRRFMMPKTRGTETGSKKRYAGLRVKDGKEEIDVTGMEFVRGDWCEAAKEFQYKLLELIFHGKEDEIKKYIKDYVNKIKEGKMDDKLIIRKSIRKELEQYTKTTPPHVKAARKLKKITSSVIEYYIAEGNEPYPAELMKGLKIDYEYYIEKQIEPLADTVLSFYGLNFRDLIKGHSQKGLSGFF